MLLRTQLAVGAILFFQTIAFGSNFARANDINDTRNLRGRDFEKEDELPNQEDRELRPFSYGAGRGFGFTTRNNRFTVPRVAGDGTQRLRPYAPKQVRPYGPNRRPNNVFVPPEPQPQPPIRTSKSSKGKNDKGRGKAGKANRQYYGNRVRPQKVANNGVQPNRGGGYINSMNWQRVPGQPIFVSNNELPTVLILDEPPSLVVDTQGNNILVDSDGNEIVVEEDEDGNLVVSVVVGSDGLGTSDTTVATTTDTTTTSDTTSDEVTDVTTNGAAAAYPLKPPPTDTPTANPTLEPTAGPTKPPSKPPTKQPTINPTKNPTNKPSKPPTRNPTANPTANPTEKPTNDPTAARR